MMGPGLAWIWIMRRFGFLAMLSVWTVSIPLMVAPHHLSGWLGERLLFWHLVPVVVAAWAVWVILSAPQRSTATDAAR